MNRRIFKPLTFLLLGVGFSLIVAWGSAFAVHLDMVAARAQSDPARFLRSWKTTRQTVHDSWNLRLQRRFAAHRVIATNGAFESRPASAVPDGFFPDWSSLRLLPEVDRDVDVYGYIENAYGWPMPCVSHAWTNMMDDRDPVERTNAGSIDLVGFRLPIRPLVTGLLVNLVFFAASAYFLSRLSGIVRRYSRRARGRCPGCDEPIRSSDGRLCDACGHAVTWIGA